MLEEILAPSEIFHVSIGNSKLPFSRRSQAETQITKFYQVKRFTGRVSVASPTETGKLLLVKNIYLQLQIKNISSRIDMHTHAGSALHKNIPLCFDGTKNLLLYNHPSLWHSANRVNAYPATVVLHISTDLGVGSSGHFPFTARTDRLTKSQTQHHHALATAGMSNGLRDDKLAWRRPYT